MKTNFWKWALGGLGVAVIYDLLFAEDVFKYIKNPNPEFRVLPPEIINGFPVNTYGKTIPWLKYEFEIVPYSGSYKVDLKKFEVTSVIYINSNLSVFYPIEKFEPYYKHNRDYVHSDYRSDFNTVEGTIFHERLHQDEFERVFETYKNTVKNVLKGFISNDKVGLEKKAKAYFEQIKLEMDGTLEKSKAEKENYDKKHKEIDLEEWKHLHDLYEKWRKQNGK